MAPVFILGFPRSGTTALASAVSKIESLQDFSFEGHLFYLFDEGFKRIIDGRINSNCVLQDEAQKQQFFASFTRAFNEAFSETNDGAKVNWIDKTPDISQIKAVPTLSILYPDAKFLYIYRPPHAAVRSNIATWPNILEGKETSVAERWAACSAAWRAARGKLPRERYLELFQEDLLEKPQQTGKAIANFLEVDQEDQRRMSQFLANNRKVNRPVGDKAKSYDARKIDPAKSVMISDIVADEISHWPRLRQDVET